MNRDKIKQAGTDIKIIFISLLIAASALLVYACDSGSDEQVSGNLLQLSISCPDPGEISEISRDSGIERSLEDIVLLRLTVEGGNPPIGPIVKEFDADESMLTIDVPIGTDRIFRIEGLDSEFNVICFGETVADVDMDTTDVDIGCGFVFEICDDGNDNDFDNLVDCADPDCEQICEPVGNDDDDAVDDDDNNDEPPTEPENCSDGIDNDGDGFIDCVDNDCIRSIDCLLPPPPTGGACIIFEEVDCFNPKSCSDFCGACCEVCGTCCGQCEFFFDEKPAFCSDP